MEGARNPVLVEDLISITERPISWECLEGKRVLISGASGYLPSYLVETLLYLNETRFSRPVTVLALVRDESKARARFAHHGARDDLVVLVQDVCAPIAVDGPVDFIIHAASQASPKYFGKDPVGTFDANVLGTHNLLVLARDKRVERLLFFSTSEVYGSLSGSDAPIGENEYGGLDPMLLRSCYAEGKRAGETMCIAWMHQHGVPVTIVRPFHIYGPGVALDDGRVFADFVANILRGQDIVMKSDGSATRSFCYVADATAAFFLALLHGESGAAYNVGDPAGVISIKGLAELLVALYPEKNLHVRMELPPDAASISSSGQVSVPQPSYLRSEFKRLVPDVSRLSALGWVPKFSLRDGFARMVRSYENATNENA